MRNILNDGNVSLVMSKFLERVIDDWVEKGEPIQLRQKPKRKKVELDEAKQSKRGGELNGCLSQRKKLVH